MTIPVRNPDSTAGQAAAEGARPCGTVYLVGAGPGDPGLLTVRAARLLRRADVVVHDALVGDRIVDLIPTGTRRFDVGKRCGGRHTSQAAINELLVELAGSARTIVRLKGGDPFVFGRGGEEALALRSAGVPFRIVPGITAAVGASAYAGIPLTHRDFSSSVTFVTGHEEVCRGRGRVDWEALARIEGTLAIYMGVGGLAAIAQRLIQAGRSPLTPAAIIEWGTHARQRTVAGPLAEIASLAAAARVGAPALVVIGEVAALRDELAWFDTLPLRGVRIVVGRSRPQPSRIASALVRLGAEVHELPRLHSAPAPRGTEVDGMFTALPRHDWILFSSAAAVKHFWDEAAERRLDARALAGIRVAAFGHATARLLERRGIRADVRTRTFDPRTVIDALTRFDPVAERRFLFPREGHQASPISESLRAAGAMVTEVEIFRTTFEDGDDAQAAATLAGADLIVLPSSSAARAIATALAEEVTRARVVCIGPVTAATARTLGLPVDAVPDEHTVAGVTRAVLRQCREASEAVTVDAASLV